MRLLYLKRMCILYIEQEEYEEYEELSTKKSLIKPKLKKFIKTIKKALKIQMT